MPEGDTVWLAGRRMHDALAGRVLTRTDFRVPQLATADLSGRTVTEVVSRGKHLLTRIDDGQTLHTHFRMDGSWHLYRPGERWRGGPAWQARVVLENAEWQAVGYRMPVVELLAPGDEEEAVGHLGPDLLGPDWDRDEALRRLRAQPDREIGQALLDQRNLAGIGNLYKAEALFLQGVSPWTRVEDVPDLPALVERARVLLERNKAHPEQSTTGESRRGRQHWVFERSGQPCRRCGTAVLLAEQGDAPYARLTYWCPRCQPGPAPAPMRRADVARPAGRTRYRP
ncbi:Fpg/Nei family DNA glycosylase [Motilibacter deserti]|uniref:DNA-(apurinic or apyrimidinic site) lyase n=1 Tax=Motilibacter deserti TaxID=2714956 RepID=A0ABX0GTZ3_9ACTN|nr:Fpg/Nei family DNA glycosylase [Motilibacter deserti]